MSEQRCIYCEQDSWPNGHEIELGGLSMLRCDPDAYREAQRRRRAAGQPEPAPPSARVAHG